MYEWLILVLNLATVVPSGGDGFAERVVAPLPGAVGAIYAGDAVDEVVTPLPGTLFEDDEDAAK